MKNINKIELLPQERSLLSNTTSWLVLQSFHPLLAGFFFLVVMGRFQPTEKGPCGP
ncbi:Uncharacterised protein [Aeromonas salmonicida]|uniref:hypothetical protein n=1 Tax=Aeromonas salmonicida TaxID=645 RepID=UPI001026A7C5|nr:hypothetical protein [Aeromonas salmonicida]VFB11486.1 Uncharacterised protein [Aeromonas salmonicida]